MIDFNLDSSDVAIIPGNYPHPSLPWWSPRARRQRQRQTIQRLKDAIIQELARRSTGWTPLGDEE
jgi:hypothetical protein